MSDETNATAQDQEMIVVDLNKRQTKKRIKQLRKGRGKLHGRGQKKAYAYAYCEFASELLRECYDKLTYTHPNQYVDRVSLRRNNKIIHLTM